MLYPGLFSVRSKDIEAVGLRTSPKTPKLKRHR